MHIRIQTPTFENMKTEYLNSFSANKHNFIFKLMDKSKTETVEYCTGYCFSEFFLIDEVHHSAYWLLNMLYDI